MLLARADLLALHGSLWEIFDLTSVSLRDLPLLHDTIGDFKQLVFNKGWFCMKLRCSITVSVLDCQLRARNSSTEDANLIHDPAHRDCHSFQCHTLVFVPLMSQLPPGLQRRRGFTLIVTLFCSAATRQTNFKRLFLEACPWHFSCLPLRYVVSNQCSTFGGPQWTCCKLKSFCKLKDLVVNKIKLLQIK